MKTITSEEEFEADSFSSVVQVQCSSVFLTSSRAFIECQIVLQCGL